MTRHSSNLMGDQEASPCQRTRFQDQRKRLQGQRGAQSRLRRLEFCSGTRGKHNKEITQFLKYLKQAGYSVHTNLTIAPNGIPLWSDDDPQKLTNNAKTLATTAGVDLIIAAGGSASVYA